MATKTMAKKKTNGLAEKQEAEMLGLQNFDTADLIIPRYKICQPTSQQGTAGTFKNNLTGEEAETLNIVALAASKGRVLWGEDIDQDPLCRSSNGLVPSENVENPVSEICGIKENGKRFDPTCENALWGVDRERPMCNETINLLCIGKNDLVPFFISLHGTQMKPVRAFLSAVGLRRRSLYEYSATLKLKETTTARGNFTPSNFPT